MKKKKTKKVAFKLQVKLAKGEKLVELRMLESNCTRIL